MELSGTTLTVDGERVVLAGASAYVLPFYLGPDGGADTSLASTTDRVYRERDAMLDRMAAAGVNTLRIPVGTQVFNHDDDVYGLGGPAGYLERLVAVVQSASDRDIRVVVGWWDAHRTGADWATSYSESFPMMRQVREALQEQPGVVYEPFNEPHDVTWDQWQTAMTETVRFWRTELDYDGVLLLDTIGYSWSFDPDYADAMMSVDAGLRPDGSAALAFANHRYANNSTCFCDDERATFEQSIGRYLPDYPIIGTEYGRWTGPDFVPQERWNAEFAAYVADSAVPAGLNGYLAFVWDWVDENSMTTDSGRVLNDYGQLVSDRVLKKIVQN